MTFLRNTNIGTRIWLALVIPVAGLVAYAAYTTVEKQRVAGEMELLRQLGGIAPTISAVVHELQKERGNSAGFIGSGGKKFGDKLARQRGASDLRLNALDAALDRFQTNAFEPALGEHIAVARQALAALSKTRKEVTRLALSVPGMAGYYTSTIGKLLRVIEEMAVIGSDANLTNAITAYTQLLQGKERAGLERAMGAAGFGGGRFKPGIYRKFLQLIAMQDTYFRTFDIFASPTQGEFRRQTLSGAAVDEVARLRKIAIESPLTGTTEGIEGAYWFDAITRKIDLMKQVEDRIAGDLLALVDEIGRSAQMAFYLFAAITALMLSASAFAVSMIARGITMPIRQITDVMRRLADGDTTIEVDHTDHGNEIGAMADAVEVFRMGMVEAEGLAEQQHLEHEAKSERAHELERLSRELEADVGSILSEVSKAAEEMISTSEEMSGTAAETSNRSATVAAAAEEASANVQGVAAATEELTGSTTEIARQVEQSTAIAGRAVGDARDTDEQIQGLLQAAQRIGEVVDLITDIANQTNLLALNATIEAARAGDAGKGFAVVASEVKNLASQTATATDEISQQINGIQSATDGAVKAIQGIGETIQEMDAIATAISTAVEEQGAATGEIARNVDKAAVGASEVSSHIQGVDEAAKSTDGAALRVRESAGNLARQADRLGDDVEQYLSKVQAC
ncbi:MAG: nitrate- and nitrite sensing domain-containing protein [Alphaproteobacteria bacterium]|nr:nitrate- and nitrite sensing domain-containing protein [Alphaproteobacteria bacterium]MDP6565195.1 nitrate- and nitrite sensing domain-containing protein [Alphaproteobacteria bacterium]MDP6811986.1 nitrate- and nitrite sensing domain-containing protein [Alphaproteobacteria bacterium]